METRISEDEFVRLLSDARERVNDMDAVDKRRDRHPETISAALAAGLRVPSSGAHFDALVMLLDVCAELRNGE